MSSTMPHGVCRLLCQQTALCLSHICGFLHDLLAVAADWLTAICLPLVRQLLFQHLTLSASVFLHSGTLRNIIYCTVKKNVSSYLSVYGNREYMHACMLMGSGVGVLRFRPLGAYRRTAPTQISQNPTGKYSKSCHQIRELKKDV